MEDTTTTTPATALPASPAPLNEFEACPLDKPSRLIRLALADLKTCKASGRYGIDMDAWHCPNPSYEAGTSGAQFEFECHVCLAGAVLAQSYRVPATTRIWDPEEFTNETTARKFKALNEFRLGRVQNGFRQLEGFPWPNRYQAPAGLPSHVPIENPTYWPEFLADMEALAATLETAGY